MTSTRRASDRASSWDAPGWLLAAIVALYLVVPGHPSAAFSGAPLDVPSIVLVALATIAAIGLGRRTIDRRVGWRLALAATILLLGKVALGIAVPAEGWRAEYFANDRLEPPARRSTEFMTLDATRLDRTIAFRDDTFPVFFFNENTFNHGIRREVTDPFSVRWTGYFTNADARDLRLSLRVRGAATVSIDSVPALSVTSSRELQAGAATVGVQPGTHTIVVTYAKPADTDGLVELMAGESRASETIEVLAVAPTSEDAAAAGWIAPLRWTAFALHGAAFLLVALLVMNLRGTGSGAASWRERVLYASLAGAYLAQGIWKALPRSGHFLALSGGDDWLQFEALSREILLGGPLITYGQPLGQGDPYFYYPLYPYFLAVVHRLTGEDLFGVIVAQFAVLLLATIVIHRFARRLVGESAALVGLVLLVVVEQLAFTRHYTTVLLSDNLYFLTVAAAVYLLSRFAQAGEKRILLAAGLACGVSAITRPSMMMLLPLAVPFVAAASRRHGSTWARALGQTSAFVFCWAAVLSLTLLRNYLVSGRPVLITSGQEWSFVLHNLPSNDLLGFYQNRMASLGGGYRATTMVLAEMLWSHPAAFLYGVWLKILFSLGMLHLMGGNVHPELMALSAGYLGSVIFCRAARQFGAWPAHLFIASHLVAMTLSMPGIYGYRLILPMYLFFAVFSGLLLWEAWSRLRTRSRMVPFDGHAIPSHGHGQHG